VVKVIGIHAMQYAIHDFLLVFYCNYVLHHFCNIVNYLPLFKKSHITVLKGLFVSLKANTLHVQPVYRIWSLQLKPFQRYFRVTKNLKWVMWRDHAPFSDSLSSVGWVLLWSTCTPNLKSLYSPTMKIWRAM